MQCVGSSAIFKTVHVAKPGSSCAAHTFGGMATRRVRGGSQVLARRWSSDKIPSTISHRKHDIHRLHAGSDRMERFFRPVPNSRARRAFAVACSSNRCDFRPITVPIYRCVDDNGTTMSLTLHRANRHARRRDNRRPAATATHRARAAFGVGKSSRFTRVSFQPLAAVNTDRGYPRTVQMAFDTRRGRPRLRTETLACRRTRRRR